MNTRAEQKLADKNVSPTAMRILVLELPGQQTSAISLTDFKKRLRPAAWITISRTLKTIGEKGLTHKIDACTITPEYALCVEE
jgi:Fur family ferric uptake transcriptional regulator